MPPVRLSSTMATPPVAWVALICWVRSLVTSNWSGSSKVSTRLVPWRAATTSVGEPGRPSPFGPVGTTSEPGDPASSEFSRYSRPESALAAEADDAEDRREQVAVRIGPCDVGREGQIGQVEAGDLLLDGSVTWYARGTYPLCSLSLARSAGTGSPRIEARRPRPASGSVTR